ncbi:hypothetical protein [Halorussus sp. AFM4]
MARWKRDADEIRADIAYAVGEDQDIISLLRAQHHGRGWNGVEN